MLSDASQQKYKTKGLLIDCRGRAKSHATGNESHLYELDQELYGPVDPDKSKISVMPRHIVLVIAKQADKEGYWPRLCKESTRQPNLQVTFIRLLQLHDPESTEKHCSQKKTCSFYSLAQLDSAHREALSAVNLYVSQQAHQITG